MPPRSQKPLVAKLLALEPVKIEGVFYNSLDHALEHMGVLYTAEQLVDALRAAVGPEVFDLDVSTLYRWRREVVIGGYKGEL